VKETEADEATTAIEFHVRACMEDLMAALPPELMPRPANRSLYRHHGCGHYPHCLSIQSGDLLEACLTEAVAANLKLSFEYLF
jgi:hypothetical protein